MYYRMNNILLDTSTLILLAKLDLLALLTEQVRVMIPEAVKVEAVRKRELWDAKLIERLIKEKKIHVVREEQKSLTEAVSRDFALGKGEAAAVILAKTRGLLLGIDDKQGIKACKVLGIPFTTTLAVIMRFHEKGIFNADQTIAKIEKLGTHGWYQAELLEKVLKEIKGGHKK